METQQDETGNIYGVEKPSYGQDGTDVLVYIGEVAAIQVPQMAKNLLAVLKKAGVSAKVLANEPASGVMLFKQSSSSTVTKQ